MFQKMLQGGGSGSVEIETLWERDDNTTPFSAQTIPLDLSKYTSIGVLAIVYSYNSSYKSNPIIYKELSVGNSAILTGVQRSSTDGNYFMKREVSCNNNGVTFGNGLEDSTKSNLAMLPVCIFGLKRDAKYTYGI